MADTSSSTLQTPLVNNEDKRNRLMLYDPETMLDVSKDVAEGFLVLLTGGGEGGGVLASDRKGGGRKKRERRAKKAAAASSPGGESSAQAAEGVGADGPQTSSLTESATELAFFALTDGNIVDASFGVHTNGGNRRSSSTSAIAYGRAMTAKTALRDAADAQDSVRRLAIEAYAQGFRTVIDYHERVAELGVVSWCLKQAAVHRQSESELADAFRRLAESVVESTRTSSD